MQKAHPYNLKNYDHLDLDLCKKNFLRATVWSSCAVLQNKAAWIDSILSQHFWRSQNHWSMANDNDDGNANPGSHLYHLCSIIFWQICQKPVLKFELHENALEWMQVKGWRLSYRSIQYHSMPHAIYTAEPHMPEDGFETMIPNNDPVLGSGQGCSTPLMFSTSITAIVTLSCHRDLQDFWFDSNLNEVSEFTINVANHLCIQLHL